MIIGVTGSRNWASRDIISRAFDDAVMDHPDDDSPVVVIEGGAHGADTLCRIEAVSRGWHPATMRALWGFYPDNSAGHIRNAAMVYLGRSADCWLAFVGDCTRKDCAFPQPHDSHGTASCILAARKAGIPVREYRYPPR